MTKMKTTVYVDPALYEKAARVAGKRPSYFMEVGCRAIIGLDMTTTQLEQQLVELEEEYMEKERELAISRDKVNSVKLQIATTVERAKTDSKFQRVKGLLELIRNAALDLDFDLELVLDFTEDERSELGEVLSYPVGEKFIKKFLASVRLKKDGVVEEATQEIIREEDNDEIQSTEA